MWPQDAGFAKALAGGDPAAVANAARQYNTGVVLVGNIGSPERMSYTVMGDGVNVAARLEGVNKELGTRICISKTVFREAGEKLNLRSLNEVTVKGRKSPVEIYELLGLKEDTASPVQV